MTNAVNGINYTQWKAGKWETLESGVVVEKAVSLTVNGELWLSFMCTPADLEAQAVGFLFNENLIQNMEDVVSVRVCPTGDNIDVWLEKSVERPTTWRRTSGCTGGVTSASPAAPARTYAEDFEIRPAQVNQLVSKLFESQELYKQVGGTHTTALSDGEAIVLTAEDIGRHNTLDKIAGKLLIEKVQMDRKILITTGRVSSEMMQKAVRMGAAFVITRTSPTNLSVEIAEEMGITLIGYARRDRFTVYTHPERISTSDEGSGSFHPESVISESYINE